MTIVPQSLTAHSMQWFFAVVLLVVADLSGLVATFLPLKSLLILASDDVPGVFPTALVNAGPMVASLSLLFAAAGGGLIAWASRWGVALLDASRHSGAEGLSRLAAPTLRQVREARSARADAVSVALLLPIAALLITISSPFFLLVMAWAAPNVSVVVWRTIQRENGLGDRKHSEGSLDPNPTWLKSSALWAVVLAAFIVLLVAPPSLGATGILLVAVFGRRLITALADLIPRIVSAVSAYRHSQSSPFGVIVTPERLRRKTVRRPADSVFSKRGSRELEDLLVAKGYGENDFLVFGNPVGPVLTLLVGQEQPTQLLLRVFGRTEEESRNVELEQRTSWREGRPFPEAEVEAGEVAGLPALLIWLDRDSTKIASTEVSDDEVARFQISHELASITVQASSRFHPAMDELLGDLPGSLQRVSRIPGAHVRDCLELIEEIPRMVEIIQSIPVGLVPPQRLTPADCCVTVDSRVLYLGSSPWVLGRPGDRWSNRRTYERTLRSLLDNGNLELSVPPELFLLNSSVSELVRALGAYDLRRVQAAIARVRKCLDGVAEYERGALAPRMPTRPIPAPGAGRVLLCLPGINGRFGPVATETIVKDLALTGEFSHVVSEYPDFHLWRLRGGQKRDLQRLEARARELLDRYGQIYIFGHSAGGFVALFLASVLNVERFIALRPPLDLGSLPLTRGLKLDFSCVTDFLAEEVSGKVIYVASDIGLAHDSAQASKLRGLANLAVEVRDDFGLQSAIASGDLVSDLLEERET